MAAWLPPLRLGRLNSQYLAATRAAREKKGEYVKHFPESGQPQWLVMWFQDMPEDLNLQGLDLVVNTSGPVLYGHLTEFEVPPSIYRNGKFKGDVGKGSRFIVRGITYQVKDVKAQHMGGVMLALNKDECCTAPDPAFFAEMEALTCWPEPDCG